MNTVSHDCEIGPNPGRWCTLYFIGSAVVVVGMLVVPELELSLEQEMQLEVGAEWSWDQRCVWRVKLPAEADAEAGSQFSSELALV